MNTYKYSNGVLESIEIPTDLKWIPTGNNYVWYCGLPSEGVVEDMAEGFNIAAYRATSDRAPYPFVAIVGFGGECGEEIYFPQLEDLIHYAHSHARLLHLTLLASIADQIDEVMKWLFDSRDGIFCDRVQMANYRAYREAKARRSASSGSVDMTKGDNK
jgi:hypothetical protein